MGAGGEIGCDALAHDAEHRHHALLVALAGDHHGVTDWRLAAVQRQRLADAQAATVKQRQQRRVALGDPGLAAEHAGALEGLARFRRRQRFGHRSRHLRRAHAVDGGVMDEIAAFQPAEEAAKGRQRPRRRGARAPRRRPARQVGAEIRRPQGGEIGQARRTAEMFRKEDQEVVEIAPVGGKGVGRGALLVRQPVPPLGDGGAEPRIEIGCYPLVEPSPNHVRMQCSSVRPRKPRSSVPW